MSERDEALVPVHELPPALWMNSARPWAGFVLVINAVLVAGLIGLTFPWNSAPAWAFLGLAAAIAIGFPVGVSIYLNRLEGRVRAATRATANTVLKGIVDDTAVKWFAPAGWVAMQRARLHLVLQDGAAAAGAFADVRRLSRAADRDRLLGLEAHAYLLTHDRKPAKAALEALMKTPHVRPIDRLHHGIVLLGEPGKVDEATTQLEAAREGLGGHPQVLAALGLAYAKLDRFEEARALVDAVEEPASPDGLTGELLKRARKELRPWLEAQQKRERKGHKRKGQPRKGAAEGKDATPESATPRDPAASTPEPVKPATTSAAATTPVVSAATTGTVPSVDAAKERGAKKKPSKSERRRAREEEKKRSKAEERARRHEELQRRGGGAATATPARPVEDAKPTAVATPLEAAKPVEAAKRVEATKPVVATKPLEAPKPAEAAKPAVLATPAEAAKPAEAPKPVEAAKPAVETPAPPSFAALFKAPSPAPAAEPGRPRLFSTDTLRAAAPAVPAAPELPAVSSPLPPPASAASLLHSGPVKREPSGTRAAPAKPDSPTLAPPASPQLPLFSAPTDAKPSGPVPPATPAPVVTKPSSSAPVVTPPPPSAPPTPQPAPVAAPPAKPAVSAPAAASSAGVAPPAVIVPPMATPAVPPVVAPAVPPVVAPPVVGAPVAPPVVGAPLAPPAAPKVAVPDFDLPFDLPVAPPAPVTPSVPAPAVDASWDDLLGDPTPPPATKPQ